MSNFHFPVLKLLLWFSLLNLTTTPAFSKKPSDEVITTALEEGDFKTAEKLCRERLNADPTAVWRVEFLAQALRGLDRVDEIPGEISPTIEAYPRNTELLLLRAQANADLKQYDAAIKDCDTLDLLGEGRGVMLAAEILEAQGKSWSAAMCYSKLLDIYTDDKVDRSFQRAEWHFGRARMLTGFHIYDWAESDIVTSINVEPTPMKLLLLGEILARQQRWEEAEKTLQQIFEMTPPEQHHIAEIRRMNVLIQMDEVDKVAFLLNQFDKKYQGTDKQNGIPNLRKALQDRLTLIAQQKQAAAKQNRPSGYETADVSAAERQQMQLLKGTTKPAEIAELKRLFIRHAQFGMESEELDYAKVMLKLLNDGLAKYPTEFVLTDVEKSRTSTVEAWVLIQQDNYAAAASKAQAATKFDTGFGDAWRILGLACYMLDKNEDAVKYVSKAIEADPLNATAHGLRALIQTDLGNSQQAATDLHRAGQLSPNNPWLAGVRAHFFESVGEHESMMRNYCHANPGSSLKRCEWLTKFGLPGLAVLDAQELRQVEGADEAAIAAIVADAGYKWFTQTLQYDTGGPTAAQVVDVCLQAHELNPNEPRFMSNLSDALRFDERYSLAIMWAERALKLQPDSASLMYQIASLQLAEGDIVAAKKANAMFQAVKFEDDHSVGLQNEMATIVEQAEELAATLKQLNFHTEVLSALRQLLATPADTARVFTAEHAIELDKSYAERRAAESDEDLSSPTDAVLRLSCISTSDLKTQDHTLFDFDEDLAGMAPRLKDGHFWFTFKYTARNENFGNKFAYFVKLDDGWKVFPRPWVTRVSVPAEPVPALPSVIKPNANPAEQP